MGQFEDRVLGLRVWKAAKLCIRKLSHSRFTPSVVVSVSFLSSSSAPRTPFVGRQQLLVYRQRNRLQLDLVGFPPPNRCGRTIPNSKLSLLPCLNARFAQCCDT